MKSAIWLTKTGLRLWLLLFSTALLAQDGGLDVDINIGKKMWYQNPVIWAVVGVIVLILLLARRRGSGSKSII